MLTKPQITARMHDVKTAIACLKVVRKEIEAHVSDENKNYRTVAAATSPVIAQVWYAAGQSIAYANAALAELEKARL